MVGHRVGLQSGLPENSRQKVGRQSHVPVGFGLKSMIFFETVFVEPTTANCKQRPCWVLQTQQAQRMATRRAMIKLTAQKWQLAICVLPCGRSSNEHSSSSQKSFAKSSTVKSVNLLEEDVLRHVTSSVGSNGNWRTVRLAADRSLTRVAFLFLWNRQSLQVRDW